MTHLRALATVFVLLATLASGNCAEPIRYFVAPQGNDAWSGVFSSPNSARTDGPFATLGRARDVVRQRRAAGAVDVPIEVLLRGGRYELAETLTFTPADSGTKKSPTIFRAYPGEEVVISGGRAVSDWKVGAQEWTVELPEVKAGGWRFRQLTVNGEWRSRPRLPHTGHHVIAGLAGADPKARYDTAAKRFEFGPGEMDPNWANPRDIEAVVLHFWVDAHLPIANIDPENRVVTFDRFARRRLTDDYQPRLARYYLSNVYEALQPGEFYLNRATGTLHYRAQTGEMPQGLTVVAPRLATLVEFQGNPRAGQFVEHIMFRQLTFSDSTWEPPAKDAVDSQAAAEVPGAVLATGARDCAIENCVLKNLGGYAVELRDGCRDVRIVGNDMTWLGAGGIKVNGGSAQSPAYSLTSRTTITDNRLLHLGRNWHSGVGVLLMNSGGNVVAHNEIGDLYYTGISVGWVWGYGPSVSRDNRIEFNHIHDVGQKLLSDMGGVYLLGIAPGTVVRNNHIHDIEAWGYGGWGLYTDEGSTGVTLENNLVYRTTHGGFHQHYGKDNVVRNNIFALARDEQIARSRMEPHLSFTFERNIVYYRTGKLFGHNWSDDKFKLDYNLYWNAAGKTPEFPAGSFKAWQARGFDVHSQIADPLFRDVKHDDFTLRDDSPALKLGFVPLDMSKVGPRK